MRRDNGSLKRLGVTPLKRAKSGGFNASTLQRFNGFALYEVLLGVTIFAVGVLALGRAVENCLNASTLNAEENAVQQVLSNRMAEVQAARGVPDQTKEFKINSGHGLIKLIQKSAPADLTEPNKTVLNGITLVTLTAHWQGGGASQSRQIRFYIYRPG